MTDLRPVLLVVGVLLVTLALAMAVPALLDLALGHRDWLVFAASGAVTLFVGLALVFGNRTGQIRFSLRQVFLLTSAGWAAAALFAALPFAFSDLDMDFTDAVFEAMSGITTTGATVVAGLDEAPPGILLWRALLQWLGGIGIIVMAISVLPVLKIGGMQIFRIEGSEFAEKVMPRAARVITAVIAIYVGLSGGLVVLLWAAGMGGFDALLHAMTTISTGGFASSDRSVAAFDNPRIEFILAAGMVMGALPFVLYLQLLRRRFRPALRDAQLRWFAGLLMLGVFGITGWLWAATGAGLGEAARIGGFTAISVMTGTGFFVADYATWQGLPMAILFFLMFIGGCAGSTSGGIKVFRSQILFANAQVQTAKLLRPHTVLIPYYNRRPIPETVADSVMGFLFVYALGVALLAMALGLLGLDFVSAVSGAVAAISNAGAGLGPLIGPGSTYAEIADPAKWLLIGGMLLGRLEMFVILVLFVPSFWKA